MIPNDMTFPCPNNVPNKVFLAEYGESLYAGDNLTRHALVIARTEEQAVMKLCKKFEKDASFAPRWTLEEIDITESQAYEIYAYRD